MRKTSLLGLIALGSALFLGSPQLAGLEMLTVDVGGTRVALPVPEGHCRLDSARHPDEALVAMIEEGNRGLNKLLLFSADCRQLDAWRKKQKKYLSDFAQILAPEKYVNEPISIARPAYIGIVAKSMGQPEITEQGMSEGKRRLEETYPKIQVNEMKSLGVLEVTDSAVFVGLLQRMLADDGVTERTIASVIAITLVKGKAINVNLYAVFEGSRTFENLLAEQKTIIANLIAAN